ncbi:MAG: hypothetical protein KGK44_10180 [Gammaproteobacteria bacterium]|nr:hypothetical protein [Gammaproteobacteria bacterium]
MLKLGRFITLILAGTISALVFISLAACSSGPNPNAKKVLVGCYAVTSDQVGKIFGVSHADSMMLSGENSPIQVCKYSDTDTGDTLALVQIKKFDATNAATELAADAAQQKALFKKNVKPIKIHDADGFGPGAFYVDNTISPSVSSVQLYLINNGFKMMIQVLNPKDFPTGEQQAAAIATQAFASIKDKTAYKTL